ncbi:radical SAM protein [Massilia pseudoviolaceinigra]|uniref:radical SAM protein n=1 Tax=Massilia pseudoviolaceinigra TaxID=3057165 RepID=UPI0027964ED2|nr:radical SAM protein [Massilia sp. CCM 9206]MDQ1923738.1 radical SAM protein [Massilia sp. CCM 9206]
MFVTHAPQQRFKAFYDCLSNNDTATSSVVSSYILVKLAARCNLACTYCYWFRDKSVLDAPKRLTLEAEDAFLMRLGEHIRQHQLKTFFILFHGGEPLLFGAARFEALCAKLRELEAAHGCQLKLAVTTNGVLVDAHWASLLHRWNVGVTVSLDGPRAVNDSRRIGFRGQGSFDAILAGVRQLRAAGVEPGFLSVCEPSSDPRELVRFFAEDLGACDFDVLVPDATHEDTPASIAAFYIGLFDAWWDTWLDRGVRIRLLDTLVRGLLGEESRIESIGFGPNTTSTLATDGAIEPLDVLRTAGDSFTRTRIDVFHNGLQDIQSDPLWREVLQASLTLPKTCQSCQHRMTCGGGHVGQRWSAARRFDNPTVYCEDIKAILAHMSARLFADMTIVAPAGALEAVREAA